MHILTKIFIVLNSLLSVALVPLVMINTANDETFKTRWLDEQARAKEAVFSKDAAQGRWELQLRAEHDAANDYRTRMESAVREREREAEEARNALKRLAVKEAEFGSLSASIQICNESNNFHIETIKATLDELNSLRSQLAEANTENNDLDRKNSVLQNQNEVLTSNNRRLKEDLDKALKERAEAQSKVSQFVAQVGDLPGARPGAIRDVAARVPADRALSATILNVRRGASGTLVEINAGSRDGVQPGWAMSIADGGKFVGNLRITTVDVNRSVGVVELEDAAGRGEVKAGLRVMSRKGE